MLASRTRRQKGLSLVEVMMGTSLLFVGFLGMIQAVSIGAESLDTARKQEIAVQIASAEIEDLRSGAWSTIANLPAKGTISINGSGVVSGDVTYFSLTNRTAVTTDDATELTSLAKGFTCSFVRTYLRPSAATSATATYVKLVYTVTWTTTAGRVQKQLVDAYFSKNGLQLSYQQS
jgi:Tfp pilus assembly protein PilV